MKRSSLVFAALAVLMLGAVVKAAQPNDATAAIAPFVDQSTIAVVRVDLSNVDYDALDKWAAQLVGSMKLDEDNRKAAVAELHQGVKEMHQTIEQFKKAGATTLWYVMSLDNFPASGLCVFPIKDVADAPALTKLLKQEVPPSEGDVALVHGAVVFGNIEHAKGIVAQARPELAQAFAAAGESPLQAVLLPSSDAMKVIESMYPELPDHQPVTGLTRGLVWAAAAVQAPPHLTARLVIQSPDNASALALRKLLTSLIQSTWPTPNPPDKSLDKVMADLAKDLVNRTNVQGDRLLLDVDVAQMTTITNYLEFCLSHARDRAQRTASMSNIHQLQTAMFLYANDKGHYPDSLDEIAKTPGITERLLTNPEHPERKPGYVYVKPSEGDKTPGGRLVFYETFDRFGEGVSVGFADGHVEWIGDEAQFNKLLHEAEQAQKPAASTKPAPADTK